MRNNIKKMYPLTPIQHGILLHSQMSESKDQYNVHLYLPVVGTITKQQVQDAFQQLVDRHDIFRTVFMYEQTKTPIQVVLTNRKTQIRVVDYSDHMKNQEEMKAFWNQANKFHLEKDQLIELVWFKFKDQEVLSFRFHHILLDGWSMGIVLNDFQNLLNNKNCTIETGNLFSFGEYVEAIHSLEKDTALQYWQNYLEGFESDFQLIGKERESESFDKSSLSLGKEEFQQLTKVLKQDGISINAALQAAWGIVLQKYIYSDDVIFGSVVSGRNIPLDNIESGVGLYINTLPTRITFKKADSIRDVLKRVQKHTEESCEYEFCSLSDIQKVSGIRGKLFDHILALENYPFNMNEESSESMVSFTDMYGEEQNNYGLNIKAMIQGEDFSVEFTYCTETFTEKEICQMLQHLMDVFKVMSTEIDMKMSNLTLVDASEKKELLYLNNGAEIDFSEVNLTDFLTERFMNCPQQLFLSDETVSYTYEQVDKLTNKIARLIINKGLKKEDVVGLYMKRTADVVLAMIGLLKAGVAFLPLDLTTPKERVEFMLKDSQVKLLLADVCLTSLSFEGEVIDNLRKTSAAYSENTVVNRSDDSDLAYIIYTSGTTGNPKGTLMERKGLINLILDMEQRYKQDHIAVAAISSISFDMFLYELTYCLGRQGEFVLASEDERKDMELLFDLLEKKNIQSMITTPSRIGLMIEHPKAATIFGNFKTLIIGGESLKNEIFEKVKCLVGGEVQNAYGPTETTVICLVKENLQAGEKITIGKPLLNTKLLVLDKHLNLVPEGGIGELYIIGPGIMRGYLKNEELSMSVKLKSQDFPNQWMYKSGDFVRWTTDKEIEFIGRIDGQRKIRGQRIEIEEIEDRFLALDGITDTVVDIIGDSQNSLKLVAFYTGTKQEEILLKDQLKKQLSSYMVPEAFIFINEMPVTSNGKANKNKLKEIYDACKTNEVTTKRRATTDIQKKIEQIWMTILHKDDFSIDSNFYERGGNSLLAMSLASKLSLTFEKTIKVSDIMNNLTIIEQERLVEHSVEKIDIPVMKKQEEILLSRAEKRMYVVEQQSRGSNAYNTFLVLSVRGNLSQKRLQTVIQSLTARHESLRIHYTEDAQGIIKEQIKDAEVKLYQQTMRKNDFLENGSKLVHEFDLGKGPLWEAHLIDLSDVADEQMLLFSFSHIIMDGFSMDIFMEDFKALMNEQPLSENIRDYSDYAYYEANLDYEKEKKFFMETLHEFPDTAMVTDYPRKKDRKFKGQTLKKMLKPEIKEALNTWCNAEKITTNTCLMGLYQLLLMKYNDKTDFVIGTITGNRDIIDTKKMIGMFANTLPIRTKIAGSENIHTYLKKFQKNYEETLMYQHYPFDLLVNELNKSDQGKKEVFHHAFIFQMVDETAARFEAGNLSFEPCLSFQTPESSKYDFSFEVMDHGDKIEVWVNYDSELYAQQTIENLWNSYQWMIEQLTVSPQEKIKNLTLLTETQHERLLTLGTGDTIPYSSKDMIVERLRQITMTTPDAKAVIFRDRTLTFKELDTQSQQLAQSLVLQGVDQKSVVGIYLERTEQFVVAMLAVLKARATYLPIDISLPKERMNYMLNDSKCSLVITDQAIDWPAMHINEQTTDHTDSIVLNQDYSLNDQAYMTYTSGTTGKPKGVVLTHDSLTNLLANMSTYLPYNSKDKLLALASVSFDMFSSEVWMPLYTGGSVVLLDDEKRYSTNATVQTLVEEKISTIITTPSRIENSFEKMIEMNAFESLKTIIFGGEALNKDLVAKIKSVNDNLRIYNGYGPTEATMYCSIAEVIKDEKITIGQAIPNVSIYILNSDQTMTPYGFSGELCVSGQALAKGYMNLEQETADKFVTVPGLGRVYRTGDFARWDLKGNIQFLGRMDTQVKINGYRVETSEIEEELIRLTNQQSCKVIAHKTKDKWEIIAFTTACEAIENVLHKLSKILPYYMMPKHIVTVEELPMTTNGKVDEKVLLALLEKQKTAIDERFAETDLEKMVEAVLLDKIPHLNRVNLNQHFMDIGGDSFKALEVISAFREQGYTISINTFMNQVNLYSIAANLEKIAVDKKQAVKEERLLSPMHQKVLGYNSIEAVNGFTQTVVLENDKMIDKDKIEEIVRKIMNEHTMLKSYFPVKNGVRIHAYGTTEERLSIEVIKCEKPTTKKIQAIAGKQEQAIAIGTSLFRMTLVNSEDGAKNYCILTLHHFLLDTISWMILLEELTGLYNETKQKIQQSSSTFHEWLEESSEYANSDAFDEEAFYWDELNQLQNTDFEPNYVGDMQLDECTLSSTETEELTNVARSKHISLDALLIAALSHSLLDLKETNELLIELESHGRTFDYGKLDLSQTIGWFTSPYPIKINHSDFVRNAPENVEQLLKAVPNKGRGYSIKRYLNNDRNYSMEPRYVFNNLGEVRTSVERAQGLGLSTLEFNNIPPKDFCVNYEIYCYSRISKGQLNIGLQYNQEKYSKQEIKQLLQQFKGRLMLPKSNQETTIIINTTLPKTVLN
ncbi:amino acid adenylation domain-containing protein [Enterococcus rotai]|uniref:amino acid adenylation domain-containing protein n=1 Tax=Enterococcus rotai TaxID=118060 RepID=UPI0035C706CA